MQLPQYAECSISENRLPQYCAQRWNTVRGVYEYLDKYVFTYGGC